jgi:DNA topoisomerase-1
MVKKKLVIVESPSKIKKISKFLGSDYVVKASMGHILDLPRKGLGIDIKNDFEPTYEVLSKKKGVIVELKKATKSVDEVFLSCDPDREGEAISEAIMKVLKRKGLTFYRVTFNEITKNAVQKAFKSPRTIDNDLVEAQKARRLVDRLTGFKISPLLWRKGKGEETSRSAGRVQSIGLQMIVERQKEIDAFVPVKYWSVQSLVTDGTDKFIMELMLKHKLYLDSKIKADKAVEIIKKNDLIVDSVEKKQEQKRPYAPFTTSTLQQACSSIFNWTPKKTMQVAQALYEGGYCTYARTDSNALSKEATNAIRTLIPKIASAKHIPSKPNVFKMKSKNTQEAHEAIRPTNLTDDIGKLTVSLASDEAKLLELIWRRAISSQMASAVFDRVEVIAKAGRAKLKATGQTLSFDGYLKVWTYGDNKENTLPNLKAGQRLDKIEVKAIEHETKPPARYNGASLIKELEANGVGRPSTFTTIIDTLLARKYVKMDKKAFVPTDTGIEVSNFLLEYFSNIINVGFTSQMEEDLDKIAAGGKTRLDLLSVFYKELKDTIDNAKVKLSTNEVSSEPCPACGEPLFVRLNRKEKQRFLACSSKSCNKTYNMDADEKPIKRIVETLGKPCPLCGGDLVKKKGKFGIFYSCFNWKSGCKVTAKDDGTIKMPPKDTGKKCKKCKKGTMLERKNRSSGDKFLGCSNYPKCKNTESIS